MLFEKSVETRYFHAVDFRFIANISDFLEIFQKFRLDNFKSKFLIFGKYFGYFRNISGILFAQFHRLAILI